MKPIVRVLLIFGWAWGWMASASCAHAATYYVSTTGSDTTGNGSPSAPYKKVVKAIVSTSNGHKIYIKAGNYGTDRPHITKSLRFFNWGSTGQARIGKP